MCQVDRRFGVLVRVFLLLCWFSLLNIPSNLSAISGGIPPMGPLGLVWETQLSENGGYMKEVEALLVAYEATVEKKLNPMSRKKVGLKVNTRGGRGLSTQLDLLRSIIAALVKRGFNRENILIVDFSEHKLRQAGILPLLSDSGDQFDGCPVLALDSRKYFDADWFYDSPLPPVLERKSQFFDASKVSSLSKISAQKRKSYLPTPLLFDVDFWINIATGVDDPALGIDGALANATLWNVSNSQRFLVNQATASAAVAEIAAIPELRERMILHIMSMECYQFIAGPFFNSIYTRNEQCLRMSSDPIAIDRLLFDRINELRLWEGFPQIDPLPRQFPFAASLGMGIFERSAIRVHIIQSLDNRQ